MSTRKRSVRPLRLCVYSDRLWRCDVKGTINWAGTQNYLITHLPEIIASGRPVYIIEFKSEVHIHYRDNVLQSPSCIYPGLSYYKNS